jgi:hypothetical protein
VETQKGRDPVGELIVDFITTWSLVFFEKPTITYLLKNFPTIMEPQGPLP